MTSKKITNLGAGGAATDAANVGQVLLLDGSQPMVEMLGMGATGKIQASSPAGSSSSMLWLQGGTSINDPTIGLYGKDHNHFLCWWYGDVTIKAESDVDNQWHLIVVLYDGQEFALYIDGKLCASKRFYKSIELATSRLHIGQKGWKDGLIDDIRIYSYALSAEEVKMLYEGKEPPRAKGSD